MNNTSTSREMTENQWIEENRTYTRDHLCSIIGCGEEFLSNLEEFFGLLPLGSKVFFYRGLSVIESLERHANGDVVFVERRSRTIEEMRALKRLKKVT